ncbi:DUF1033 family protein [Jeotgalibacillus terrae]|uniref:DUF1033 family protein n=1 Tax=Jeotgalibacillus terrae TaxID=587735 RepID=A0ABW5ZQ93_9BACL|nr:DUF1033 family protein [Jeotgalibacillus terrae]MBM7580199.1 hypothetical protein [Jeotgalibacillus terrae]
MWRIVQLKSDAEPWWFLDGWESDIVKEWTFDTKKDSFTFYKELMEKQLLHYEKVRVKRGTQSAFWDPDEFFFCDDCDEDLQVYHGFILFQQQIPFTKDHMTDDEKRFFESIFTQKKEA